MTDTPTARIIPYASAPFGVEFGAGIEFGVGTGQIIVRISPLFCASLVQNPQGVPLGEAGGWLPDRQAEERAARKRAKIKIKRERRQDYVMRKIYMELKGLEPDEYLLELMAEFETVDDIFKTDEQTRMELQKAYYDYIIVQLEAQAAQDNEDEIAIMFALSQML